MAAPPSPDQPAVDLHHPLPDLQSLQGAYVGNISRLEEHAERMSEAGSDLNEEIRRLHSELKHSDSRRSSLRSLSTPHDDGLARVHTGRSRNLSTSSHANSVVDTNAPARWGGYSPAGYVTSPVGSLRSGSWSIPPTSLQRHRSGSRASRLAQVVHPPHVQAEDARPASPSSIVATPVEHRPARQPSSFTRKYDAIANEIRNEMRGGDVTDMPDDPDMHDAEMHHPDMHHPDMHHHHDLPDRPPTAASTDTTHQARTLWHDFDGTHAPDTVPEEPEPDPDHPARSRNSSLLRSPADDRPPPGLPPPDDGMVFYPAPVPRMLNLPKRLSQLPAGDVAARRRTQVLDQIQAENRQSAPWLAGPEPPKPSRKSRQSFAGLPAQLRASAFFDQPGPPQAFEVKGESAQDTLDSILEASARAPVSAFTDHPLTGRSGRDVYSPEHKRKSSKFPAPEPAIEPARRRSSFNILDTTTNSSGGKLNKLKKRNSSADMNILLTRATESRMSLGAELDERDEQARGPNDHDATSRRSSWEEHDRDPGADSDDPDHDPDHDQALEEDEEEEEQYFGAPTTLLAELQLRKAKQKERNMNYVTMVEEGRMTSHRTLLELNDDAEREKQKRLKKKVQLAWEAQDDDSEDDIPLGVLYKQPQRNDWDKPLGLIAQRELEDSEPLSRRRDRLTGGMSSRRTATLGAYDSHTNIPRVITPQPESDGEEQETLGERMRRLKDKQMLEAALGDDVRNSTVSGDFAAEMLAKLGVDDSPKPPKDAAPEDGEEETLGQRRARLKAEADARGDILTPGERPTLRSKMSLADVLSANPYDDHHQARKVSNEQLLSHLPAGSLLAQNALAEERRKAHRLTQTMRASSYGTSGPNPLLPGVAADAAKADDEQPLALKIQAYKDRMAGVAPADQPRAQSMMFGAPMGGNMTQPMGMNMPMSMPINMSMPMLPFPHQPPHQTPRTMPPQMQMPMPMPMNMSQMPMQMPMQMNMPQMQMQMPMNMPMQMPMQMPMLQPGVMGLDPHMAMLMQPMNTQQRSNIEGWMKGIR